MKGLQIAPQPPAPSEPVSLNIKITTTECRVLGLFASTMMQDDDNTPADAARCILTHALLNFSALLPKMTAFERYCEAEGFKEQRTVAEAMLQKQFPKKLKKLV